MNVCLACVLVLWAATELVWTSVQQSHRHLWTTQVSAVCHFTLCDTAITAAVCVTVPLLNIVKRSWRITKHYQSIKANARIFVTLYSWADVHQFTVNKQTAFELQMLCLLPYWFLILQFCLNNIYFSNVNFKQTYGDGAGYTVDENSGIVCLIQMRY